MQTDGGTIRADQAEDQASCTAEISSSYKTFNLKGHTLLSVLLNIGKTKIKKKENFSNFSFSSFLKVTNSLV